MNMGPGPGPGSTSAGRKRSSEDPLKGNYVSFTGLVGSLETKAFTANADKSICCYCGNGAIYRSTDDGHVFTLAQTLAANIAWAVRLSNNHLLCGLTTGAIFRSTDNGASWTARTTIPANGVREGSLIQTQAGTILVGSTGGHIYRSTDEAGTWADIGQLNSATSVRELHELSTGRILAGLGLAAAGNSIYKSDDDGLTWNTTTMPGVNRTENVMVIAEALDGSVVAHGGTDTDLWRSTDHGDTWVVQESGGASGILVLAMYTVPVTGTILTAGTSESSGGPVVRRSVDAGASFTPNHATGGTGAQIITGEDNSRAFIKTPTYGAVLIATQGAKPVWRSTTDGASWTDPTS